jgi:hypothetical protein
MPIMIKSVIIRNCIMMISILAIAGLICNHPLIVTTQISNNKTTKILSQPKNIHNTTTAGDGIVHRGIVSSEDPGFLVPAPGEENQRVEILRLVPIAIMSKGR